MSTVTIHDRNFTMLFAHADIVERVRDLAHRINADFQGHEPVFVVLLNGAMFFAVDLLRDVSLPCFVDTLRASSYGDATVSSGNVRFLSPLPDVRDKAVILVEDIVDTGLTLSAVIDALRALRPRSLHVAAFINKPDAHQREVTVDYACYSQNVGFVVGYGLDYAGHGRELRDVYEIIDAPVVQADMHQSSA